MDGGDSLIEAGGELILFTPDALQVPASFGHSGIRGEIAVRGPERTAGATDGRTLTGVRPGLQSSLCEGSLGSFGGGWRGGRIKGCSQCVYSVSIGAPTSPFPFERARVWNITVGKAHSFGGGVVNLWTATDSY